MGPLTCTAISSTSVLPYVVSRNRFCVSACAVVVVDDRESAEATKVA